MEQRTKTVAIRSVPEDVAEKFSIGAKVRGITQAEYLFRLLVLRDMVAEVAEIPHEEEGYRAIVGTMRDCDLGKVNA